MAKKKEYSTAQVAKLIGITYGSLRNHIARENCSNPNQRNTRGGYVWSHKHVQQCKRELKDRLPDKAKARKR